MTDREKLEKLFERVKKLSLYAESNSFDIADGVSFYVDKDDKEREEESENTYFHFKKDGVEVTHYGCGSGLTLEIPDAENLNEFDMNQFVSEIDEALKAIEPNPDGKPSEIIIDGVRYIREV